MNPSSLPNALAERITEWVAEFQSELTARGLGETDWSLAVVDLHDPLRPVTAGYRADQPFYPASVVKLFYLAAVHAWQAQGRIGDTVELRRACHDMMVHSWNEPTGYVLDVLTETTSGPELPLAELAVWADRREAVNRYFAGLGYTGVVASKKTWNEGPYGRDSQVYAELGAARNSLTAAATARLLTEIVRGECVSPTASQAMLELMRREPHREDNPDIQAREFIGPALPPGSRLWSKAGYMSEVRHDAAYVELPGGARLVLVIFTRGKSDDRNLISDLARPVLRWFVD